MATDLVFAAAAKTVPHDHNKNKGDRESSDFDWVMNALRPHGAVPIDTPTCQSGLNSI